MSLRITNPETDRLAREIAALTGETLSEVVTNALRERLEHERRKHEIETNNLVQDLLEIGRRCASQTTIDSRSADELLGYDEHGLPS